MKITKVDVMQVKTPNPSWRPILCRVYTDEGIYGDGEAALAYGIAAPAAFGMIRDLAALIIGMDPLDNEVVWDTLYKNTFWGQNGGPVVFAGISAIDFALWDIRGKFFNVPVYKLLGGKKQDNLRCYASQLQFGWSDHWEEAKDTEEYAANARKAVEEGYDATKEWVPVVPAQHYFMGGIWVNSDSLTSMEHLYAAGETSCNGVHGANRLASNSLLESLVFAKRAAKKIGANR